MPDDWYELEVDPARARKEREKARALRSSAWWQRRLQRGICFYCNKSFAPRDLTMDHVVPIARGGRSTKGNLVPACGPCNAEKRLKTPAEIALLAARAADGESVDE